MAAARQCGDGVKTILIASPFVDRARRLKHTLLHSAGSANACVHPLAPSERQLDSTGFDSDPSHEVLLADSTASLSDALLAFAEVPNGYLSISGLPKPSLCIADIEHGPALPLNTSSHSPAPPLALLPSSSACPPAPSTLQVALAAMTPLFLLPLSSFPARCCSSGACQLPSCTFSAA
jgi:hypothetical protein